MDVDLLLAADCPNAAAARRVLARCLHGLDVNVAIRERVGDFPSPTILVDGIDVMTGVRATAQGRSCRLDVPTVPRVLAALRGTELSSWPPPRPAT